MLSVENISYTFGEKAILTGISFEAGKGQVVAISGPNGAGKSTLLRLIAGDIAPRQGKVHLYGKEMLHYPLLELARQRAVLVQQSEISMGFSVEDIVLMGRYPHFNGKPSIAEKDKVTQALNKTALRDMGQRVYSTLSGGERQRANLSKVLAQVWEGMAEQGNKLLLLDEPLNNLDIEHQHQILEIAREFARKGNTVITVLHDLNMAARFADRMLLLFAGKLFADGEPADVLTPENICRVFQYPAQVHKHPFLDCPMVYYGCAKQSGPGEIISKL